MPHDRGNETVPTVHIAGATLVNPSPDAVLTVMRQRVPHLVPDDAPETKEPSRIGRAVLRILEGRKAS